METIRKISPDIEGGDIVSGDVYGLSLPSTEIPNPDDVAYFESELYSDTFADSIFSKLGSYSDSLSESKKDFEMSLEKAVRTSESSDVIDSMRKLSDYTLQVTMMSKTAGKLSQAVDKLTNLQ